MKDKIDRWLSAVARVEAAKKELNHADTEYRNAVIALGNSVAPKDACHSEKFCILVGDKFLEVEVLGQYGGNYNIRWRNGRWYE